MKNSFSTLLAPSLLAAAGLAIASSAFTPVSAASLTFDVFDFTGDNAQAKITLDEVGNDIKFTVDVVNPPTPGDIRGVFFNIFDNTLLSDLGVSGLDVTDSQFGPPGGVSNLGGGANINPKSFDAGVEIGTSGAGRNFIPSTMFTLSRNSGGTLALNQFFGQEFGVRLTSTIGTEGSSKLAGTAPVGPSEPVPEPGTIVATGLFAAGTRLLKKKKAIAQG